MPKQQELEEQVEADIYFLNRLQRANRAKSLPPTARFDLARSPLSDDELDEAIGLFGELSGR